MAIGQTIAICLFFKMAAVRHFSFIVCVLAPPTKYFLVFIVVLNLIGIDA